MRLEAAAVWKASFSQVEVRRATPNCPSKCLGIISNFGSSARSKGIR